MNFNLIIPHNFRENIEKHKHWQLDLGNAYTQKAVSGVQVNIKDPFVIMIFQKYNTFCYKVGRMGSLNFYTSVILPDTEIWIFDDENNKFVIPYNSLDLQLNPEKYIAKILLSTQDDGDNEEN